MNNKVLIKASAGTGKTFSLATHAIRLMLLGTPPRAIVGLTFSRAAAGEIFYGIAKRLAEAALNDARARKETTHVMEGLDATWAQSIWQTWAKEGLVAGAPADRHLAARVYARLLRSFVHEQHVSRIGTIDSFMAQMVKAFPVELGLEGAMAVMDDFEAGQQKRAAADALLASAGGNEDSQTFVDEFRLAMVGKESKRFCDSLDEFVKYKHEAFLQQPECTKWGDPTVIWGPAGIPYRNVWTVGEFADRIETQIIAALEPHDKRTDLKKGWPAVAEFIRGFTGSFTDAPTPLKNIIEVWGGSETIPEFKCNRISTVLRPEDTKLISTCLETLFHIVLSIRCGRTQGIYRLMKRLDANYAQNTRQRGRLTFSDIPRMIAQLGEVSRLNLEYRFDGELRHWALDEFQDTSHEQWEAIHNLVEEAKTDPERSVFVVGDMKQAIYGWRGGDVAIFEREVASGCYVEQNMAKSHRYCQEIAVFANSVFDGEKIAAFLTGSEAEAAGKKWQALWLTHEAVPKMQGCVTVARVRKAVSKEMAWEPFVEPLCADLLRISPWERGISAAVLVSKNDHGEALADALRKAGVPVTWEGESDIADTPVVQAFLNLLRVAEHPDDTLAWTHLCASPLAAAKPFAQLLSYSDGRDPKERVIVQVTTDVSRLGLARTLREYADAAGETYDAFTRNRIDSLVRAAAEYAAAATAEMSLTDFADYVEAYRTRAAADTSVVKIVTVHRSKGLGFDYVLVPVIDDRKITALSNQRTFHAPDWAWLLDQPPPGAAIRCDAVLSAANRAEIEAGVFEDLCAYYVSMTRAKRALSVYLRTGGEDLNFSNHIEKALGQTCPVVIGDAVWYEGIFRKAERTDAQEWPKSKRRPRVTVQRATPSRLGHANVPASTVFEAQEAGAAERGSRIHELLSKCEWLDGGDAARETIAACGEIGIDLVRPSAFRAALTRPDGEAEVWRERNFEMLEDGQWTSGTFDRVVFTRLAGGWRAAIYDYKSNRRRGVESAAAFEARMKETYLPQMTAYRQAVAKLAGLDERTVSATLLLTETLSGVTVV